MAVLSFLLSYGVEILVGLAVAYGWWQFKANERLEEENQELIDEVEDVRRDFSKLRAVAEKLVEGKKDADVKVKDAVNRARSDRTDYFN